MPSLTTGSVRFSVLYPYHFCVCLVLGYKSAKAPYAWIVIIIISPWRRWLVHRLEPVRAQGVEILVALIDRAALAEKRHGGIEQLGRGLHGERSAARVAATRPKKAGAQVDPPPSQEGKASLVNL